MDLPGSAYLFTLAVIAVTFVGFTAIVVILRQTLGGKFLPIDALVARLFMVQGFFVTFAGLSPAAFAEYDPAFAAWQISGVLAAISIATINIGYGIIRQRITQQPNPTHVWAHIGASMLIALLLLGVAGGVFAARGGAVYTTGVTLYMLQIAFAFVQHFGFMLGQVEPSRTR